MDASWHVGQGDGTINGTGESRLWLASRSPRRRQLLHEAGLPHDVVDTGLDDSKLEPGVAAPEAWAAALAHLKCEAGAAALVGRAGPRDLVIGADTTCVVDGQILGQAESSEEAAAMIGLMSGRFHEVLTGVAIRRVGAFEEVGRGVLFVERALVRLGPLRSGRIAEYARSEAWRGKAGAYNLTERVAAGWDIQVEGDWTCVVGLPMGRVLGAVRELRASCVGAGG